MKKVLLALMLVANIFITTDSVFAQDIYIGRDMKNRTVYIDEYSIRELNGEYNSGDLVAFIKYFENRNLHFAAWHTFRKSGEKWFYTRNGRLYKENDDWRHMDIAYKEIQEALKVILRKLNKYE